MARKCGDKVCHKSRGAAYAALKRINNVGLVMYKCGCGSWHLGHSNKPEKLAARIDQLLTEYYLNKIKSND